MSLPCLLSHRQTISQSSWRTKRKNIMQSDFIWGKNLHFYEWYGLFVMTNACNIINMRLESHHFLWLCTWGVYVTLLILWLCPFSCSHGDDLIVTPFAQVSDTGSSSGWILGNISSRPFCTVQVNMKLFCNPFCFHNIRTTQDSEKCLVTSAGNQSHFFFINDYEVKHFGFWNNMHMWIMLIMLTLHPI